MQAAEQLQAFLLGKHYGSFSVATAFGLDFDGFELAVQDVQSPDEELVNRYFVNSYAPATKTATRNQIAQTSIPRTVASND